jgi:hypothetical protein
MGSGFEPQAPHLRKRHLLILLREKTVSSHEHRLPCLCERGIRSRKVTASPSHRNQLPTRCGGGPGRRRVRPRADHSHMRPRAREHCDGCSPRGSGGSASGTNSSAGSHRTRAATGEHPGQGPSWSFFRSMWPTGYLVAGADTSEVAPDAVYGYGRRRRPAAPAHYAVFAQPWGSV